MGIITDLYNFNYNFILLGVLSLSYNGILAVMVPAQTASETKARPGQVEWGALCRGLCRWTALVFYLQVALMGASIATVERLLFVFLQSPEFGINASTTLCGASVAISVLLELPIFYNAKAIVNRLGPSAMWSIAALAMSIRAFLFTLVTPTNVWYVVPLAEAFHGVTFACFWTVGIEGANQLLPMEWKTTSQTLYRTAYNGIGISCGSLLGGYFMESYGPRDVYAFVSTLMMGMFGARCLSSCFMKYYGQHHDNLSSSPRSPRRREASLLLPA